MAEVILPQAQEGQQILNRINKKKTIPRHIMISSKTPKTIKSSFDHTNRNRLPTKGQEDGTQQQW